MTDYALHCHNVTKTYGAKRALDSLELAIPGGRVSGVLGPNGSGKSTLFRLTMGLSRPDSGDISVLGQPPGWETNGKIAYLPDRARWFPDHTVSDAFQWAAHFLPGFNAEKAEELADFMHIDLESRAAGMSRGEEARLMLTLCVARDVPLLLLDEPFAGIDVVSRDRIVRGLIDHIGTSEQTILISTHDIYEVESLFDHVVFLDRGKVKLAGDVDDLRRAHGSMDSLFRETFRDRL
ncbi:ABC transporter ATP-binding protein [Numidum massiliense]|uniref:ABC transporter ATP-binding protein n=1 Tax=Numidum massiliense TaxID=1522315 RepID=UPI0006D56640|nr:ABC transporter ATP-binding protein [Numidum massiliense]